MQKRKFDELISHFNRNVSDMSIDRKYKIELLGMISAIGFAHEEELGTNLASLGTDCISRQAAIDALKDWYDGMIISSFRGIEKVIDALPPVQPEITHKQAVEYLQSTGWLQEHDRQMMLDGVHRLTAQPEIVRCKDCKHWIPYDWMFSEVWRSKNMADYPEDEIGRNWCDMAMKANDFCSRGEKREVTT